MTTKDVSFTSENESSEVSHPITFADLGIPTESKTQITIIGATRTCSSLTKWEWLYLIVSVTSLITSLILTFCTIPTLKKDSFDLTFALVLIYTTLFCFYYVIHGVLKERAFELMVFVITIIILLIYSIMNYISQAQNESKLKLMRLILVCVLGPVLITAGIWLSREYYLSGNLIYRTVGANINLQSMCQTMFLCSTLLKFDLQLQGSMVLLVMEKGTQIKHSESIILGIGFTITIIFVSVGFLSMRYENKILISIFLIMSISEPAYIIYKFYVASDQVKILHKATYICGVLALIIWGCTIVCMYYVMKNFGKGLKEKVYGLVDPEVIPESEVRENPENQN